MSDIKYLYGLLSFLCFVLIVLCNGAVIAIVALHQSLHEPMYIFISVLCLNGLYGSSAFLPSLFVNLLYRTQTVSYAGCLTQVYCIHTYMGCELTILTVMAFDRYVCICNPLRYNCIMSLKTVFKLVVAAWLYTLTLFTTHFILTVRLPLCDSAILKIYCDNWSVVRLSCADTSVNNIFGLFITAALIGLMPVLIVVSYFEILRACVKSSRDFRSKALQTCTPHLITMVNYVVDVLFEILLHRFKPTSVPYELRVVMSLQFLVVPPLLNPIIYGLKIRKIRFRIVQLIHPKRITVQAASIRIA
ncbi:olfactory receptor 52D1-like [Spea bombifrons]|uniref:olfactory receptor 52D1-like n=1 Tax=Spea bombifrons TaxID=233779 RepID=UPI0023490363|nr:olfactory receptor 52D1-like [Spea bombifrons]